MPQLAETYACVPSTERGRGILISGHPKSNSILYTNGRSVIILDLSNPLQVSIYGEHAYPATVARFSPNGEWIASADVSGTVRIWGAHNDHVLKKEFRVLSGRIDDLQWSPDGLRIVACGDGKGKSLVRAFMSVLLSTLHFTYITWFLIHFILIFIFKQSLENRIKSYGHRCLNKEIKSLNYYFVWICSLWLDQIQVCVLYFRHFKLGFQLVNFNVSVRYSLLSRYLFSLDVLELWSYSNGCITHIAVARVSDVDNLVVEC